MSLGPRAKLLLLLALFALPIVASLLAYRFMRPAATGNYGELLLPPATIVTSGLQRLGAGRFEFSELAGKWVIVASDSGDCPAKCVEKLVTVRQVRLALGRNAARIERVLVIDDRRAPAREILAAIEGMVVVSVPAENRLPVGVGNDRAHLYLVDPNGNVMMRWPANADRRRMYKDLERLLKASQIG